MSYQMLQLDKDSRAEAKALQKQAEKRGAWGSWGALAGSLLPSLILGPGAGLIFKALAAGIGSAGGAAVGKALSGAEIDTGGLFHQDAKEEAEEDLKYFSTDDLTAAGTAAVGQFTADSLARVKEIAQAKTHVKNLELIGADATQISEAQSIVDSLKDKGIWKGGLDYEASPLAEGWGNLKEKVSSWGDKTTVPDPSAPVVDPNAKKVTSIGSRAVDVALNTAPIMQNYVNMPKKDREYVDIGEEGYSWRT